MAPALTEAATEARSILSSNKTGFKTQTGLATNVNEMFNQKNGSCDDKVSQPQPSSVRLSTTQPRILRRVGFADPLLRGEGNSDNVTNSKMQRNNSQPSVSKSTRLVMGYQQKVTQKTPILLPVVGPSGDNRLHKVNHIKFTSTSSAEQEGHSSSVESSKIETELMANKVIVSMADVTETETIADSKKKQLELERKADRLLRRVRHLQSKHAVAHTQNQLKGLVQHQHHNLQSMAKSMKTPPENNMDFKAELRCEDVRGLSTSALVALVRKLQSQQALSLRQRLTGSSQNVESEPSILKLDQDLCTEMNRVSGTLQMDLHHLEDGVDSDATESSSGGESCDEDYDLDDEALPQPSLQRRAEWHWAMDRAAIAARWTWLQAQVSDLEYRIRQQSDIFKQIRAGKGAVSLGDPPPPGLDLLGVKPAALGKSGRKLTMYEEKIANIERKNTEMSPCNLTTLLSNVDKQSSRLTQQLGNVYSPAGSPMLNSKANAAPPKPVTPNGLVDSACGQQAAGVDEQNESSSKISKSDYDVHFDPPSPTVDTTCIAARCRPVRSYGKRKLLRTSGLHQLSRKAARLSTVNCQCYPPQQPCAMCGGRYNNTHLLDPITMPFAERVALLDSSFHPVLSFDHDVPLPIHFEALLKSGDWQHKTALKPVRSLSGSDRRRNRITDRPVRKYTRRLPKNTTAAMVSSAKIKNKYEHKQHPRNIQGPNNLVASENSSEQLRLRKRKANSLIDQSKKRRMSSANSAMGDLSHSASSASLKDQMRRRRGESAFDINNIVIPYSMAASTRVEKLQYKEIVTPSWREIEEKKAKEDATTDKVPELDAKTEENSSETEVKKELPPSSDQEAPTSSASDKIAEESRASPVTEKPKETATKPLFQKVDFPNSNTCVVKKEELEEDITDETIRSRHMRCEVLEKKKFNSYIQLARRGRGIRSDSSSNPDGSDPAPTTSSLFGLQEVSESRRRSGSASSNSEINVRRRNSSASKLRSRSSSIEDKAREDFPQLPQVSPWHRRTFPLNDNDFDNLFKEPSQIISYEESEEKVATFMTNYLDDPTAAINPTSPFSDSSTISNVMEEGDFDDPNDPEWTVVGGEKSSPKPSASQGLVIKLAKR